MCRNVYIHNGSISHLSGRSVEYKRKIRDKRKYFFSQNLFPFSLHFDFNHAKHILWGLHYEPFTSGQMCLRSHISAQMGLFFYVHLRRCWSIWCLCMFCRSSAHSRISKLNSCDWREDIDESLCQVFHESNSAAFARDVDYRLLDTTN